MTRGSPKRNAPVEYPACQHQQGLAVRSAQRLGSQGHTVLTGSFSVRQTPVGCTHLGLQLVEMAKAPAERKRE
jgi:hypothetical protein